MAAGGGGGGTDGRALPLTGRLARGVGSVPAQSGDWPIDLVSASGSDDRITLTDITNFLAPTRRLNTFPGHINFSARWDLVPGSDGAEWIIINDLTSIIAGASANPPMNAGGPRVYDSAFTCSAHPVYGK
jgi:hypothetical protein